MKKLLLASVGLLFTSFVFAGGPENVGPLPPPPLAANNGPYIGIHGGVAFASNSNNASFDTGFDVGGEIGYRFSPNVRIEGAFTFLRNGLHFNHIRSQHHDVDSSNHSHSHRIFANLNSYLFMANAIYDLQVTPVFNPFIGVGIGANVFSRIRVTDINNRTFTRFGHTSFAYQGIAGIGLNIIQSAMMSVRYRFVGNSNGPNYNIIEAGFDYFF